MVSMSHFYLSFFCINAEKSDNIFVTIIIHMLLCLDSVLSPCSSVYLNTSYFKLH